MRREKLSSMLLDNVMLTVPPPIGSLCARETQHGVCCIRLATLLPYPRYLAEDLGQWLCVPPFQTVCLFQDGLYSAGHDAQQS